MKIKSYFLDQNYKYYNIIPQKHKREIFEKESYNFEKDEAKGFHFKPYNCLPLKIANELGWTVTCPCDFSCIWDGDASRQGVKIFSDTKNTHQEISKLVMSHFSAGTLTFIIPYIFRTPKKYALYLRGPTNYYKEGIQYLDAVVETDWLNYSFTYNIKIHSINKKISFKKGEPLFSFIPLDLSKIHNSYVEVQPASKKIKMEHALFIGKRRKVYAESVNEVIKKLKNNEDLKSSYWMRDYFQGGAASNLSENKIIGCPFLHFVKLNLDVIENLTFKEKINKKIFLIKEKIKEKIITTKNTIRKIYFDSYFFTIICSRKMYNERYNRNISLKEYFKIYIKIIFKNGK